MVLCVVHNRIQLPLVALRDYGHGLLSSNNSSMKRKIKMLTPIEQSQLKGKPKTNQHSVPEEVIVCKTFTD